MSVDEQQRAKGRRQVRWLKRLMRPLPRRANVHRYPVIKWFAGTARRRAYLWSFREVHVIPAIYAGCVLSLLPLYGVQFISAFALSLALRANFMVFAALQLITNPLTAAPLYLSAYQIGSAVITTLGISMEAETLEGEVVSSRAHLISGFFKATAIGGTVMGLCLGFILSLAYRLLMRRFKLKHQLMQGVPRAQAPQKDPLLSEVAKGVPTIGPQRRPLSVDPNAPQPEDRPLPVDPKAPPSPLPARENALR
jgi:uncharacterized protein (DUF2062 family)